MLNFLKNIVYFLQLMYFNLRYDKFNKHIIYNNNNYEIVKTPVIYRLHAHYSVHINLHFDHVNVHRGNVCQLNTKTTVYFST